MSTSTQVPITERVCTSWDTKITGFRDLSEQELLVEEQFTNGIPGIVGLTLEELVENGDYISPVVTFPQTPANTVGGFVTVSDTPPEVPVPEALGLFMSAMLCFLLATKRWSR